MDLDPGARAGPLARVGTALRVLPAGAKIVEKLRGMTRLRSKAALQRASGSRSKKGHALVEQSADQRRGGQCDHPGNDYTSGNTPTNR